MTKIHIEQKDHTGKGKILPTRCGLEWFGNYNIEHTAFTDEMADVYSRVYNKQVCKTCKARG